MLRMIKRHWIFISISAIIIFLVTFFKNDFTNHTDEIVLEVPAELEPEIKEETNEEEQIVIVDIKGEVDTPGIYEVEAESRVHDVIQIAGGLTSDADDNAVNLAERVTDEMVIMVPKSGEQAVITSSESNNRIAINNASQEEIESLSGIGPSKAAAIIQYREENGRFETAEDLLQVSGIGEKTLENIRDELQVP